MEELISIIIPVFKVEKYIRRCVDSIIKQSYKNIEIILVNDGSPDKCGEICDQYANEDKRVKVLHKKNGGLSEARNSGIEVATGKYVTFIDSDDWIHESYLNTLYSLIINHNGDISVCNLIEVINYHKDKMIENEKVNVYSNLEAIEQLTGSNYSQMVVACGKLYRKSLFDNINFPVNKIHEDEYTTYKLFYAAYKIVVTNSELYYYFQREGSITKSEFNIRNRIDAFEAVFNRAIFMEEIGLKNASSYTYRMSFWIYREIYNKSNKREKLDYTWFFKKEMQRLKRKNKKK